MSVKDSYDKWSEVYDTNVNRTRDMEANALRALLDKIEFNFCLEIGCGTGKNSEFLITRALQVTAVDFSGEMIAKARQKILSENIRFIEANVKEEWAFGEGYDLVTFSLVLEHIENLDQIFREASRSLTTGGYVYVGELHPFKQYAGSQAKFVIDEKTELVECFNHHISDFTSNAKKHGLDLVSLNEYFDDDDRKSIPRVLAILFRKKD